ncbi:hypothetical protein NUM3379_03740 [Kineococcus sp. NUM-3379]
MSQDTSTEVPSAAGAAAEGGTPAAAGEGAAASAAASPTPASASPTPASASPTPASASPTPATLEEVEEALRDVVDPELGINVVDLGLIYGLAVSDDNLATIDMTLTSAACPLTDVIEEQTAQALEDVVAGHRINWVWMPPWGPEKITDDGRDQLRALGFNV